MRLIDLLNKLEQDGVLAPLYQAGMVTLAAYTQRELYNTYQALLATPRYADQPAKAVEATVAACGISRSTVYKALQCMEKMI